MRQHDQGSQWVTSSMVATQLIIPDTRPDVSGGCFMVAWTHEMSLNSGETIAPDAESLCEPCIPNFTRVCVSI